MVMLDRRKLAAPLAAQAAAFVAVLVIGQFTSHTSTVVPVPGHTVSASPRAVASASALATKGAPHKIIVRVLEDGTNPLSVAGSQVKVLNRALTSVASGVLDSTLKYAANVPADRYQVCINPIGWASATGGTNLLDGWICAAADARTGPAVVTFRLVPQAPQVSPVGQVGQVGR